MSNPSTTQAIACRSWLGYRSVAPLTVAVCGWCADRVIVEAWAAAQSVRLTHGICVLCHQAMTASLLGEVQAERDLVLEAQEAFACVQRPAISPVDTITMDRSPREDGA